MAREAVLTVCVLRKLHAALSIDSCEVAVENGNTPPIEKGVILSAKVCSC